ncbi:hypothetical protein K501DRAFT_262735 [Backusella circina FSU 941]|nr:hypothetical protein K501DRAFT_262735 [Backusella circina FSU 941]
MVQPQTLISNTVNPANLLELQVLSKIVQDLDNKNDIKGAIPYLAKMTQIVDNQAITKPTDQAKLPNYHLQMNELSKTKANAHAQLAEAFYKTHDFMQCESSLTVSIKIWEKLVRHDTSIIPLLTSAYDRLKLCYEALGKNQMANNIESRKTKLLTNNKAQGDIK